MENGFFLNVDIFQMLMDRTQANRYWADIKKRSTKENDQPFAFCDQLKMIVTDGRKRLTDCAILRGY